MNRCTLWKPGSKGRAARNYVETAVSALRENDYAARVTALQAVQQVPNVTSDQLKAVHETMPALTSDSVERASRGDAAAQAALAAIERTRSQ